MTIQATIGEQQSVESQSGNQPGAAIRLTPKAVEMALIALHRQATVGSGLRIAVLGGGCSGLQYHLELADSPAERDEVVEQGGVRIFIDGNSKKHLEGVTLDYATGLHGAGFKFLNPAASRTCGCGSSFAT